MQERPFENIKVADFTVGAVGTVATKYLADQGATVLHIESSSSVEVCRTGPPFKDGVPGISGWGVNFNSSKYGITLNLRTPEGKQLAKKIAAWADVIVNNMPTGTLDKWGLGYEEVKAINPDIIICVSCMQGNTGPFKSKPGYGSHLQALSGFTEITGWPDRHPSEIYMAYTDFISPRFVAAAIAAALEYKRRTGKGQFLDMAQLEMGVQFLSPLLLDYTVNERKNTRAGNRSAVAAPHGAYRCLGEDRWCAIAVTSDKEWESLCKVAGDLVWTKDPKFSTLMGRLENVDKLERLLEEWTVKFTPEELMAKLQAAGVPAGLVANGADLHKDPQLKHRNYFQVVEQMEIGPFAQNHQGFRLSKCPNELLRAGPAVGEHNDIVFTEILGLSDEEFTEYMTNGAIE